MKWINQRGMGVSPMHQDLRTGGTPVPRDEKAMTAIPHPIATPHAHDDAAQAHHHEELGFVKKYLYSCDHKIIGIQFLFLGLLFMIVGGLLAMLIRWQLA